ncbi:hypothetical protein Agub_g6314 [Astrephomene gubernaculifera]|uniref:F-box domain-containing protein n=1 Tax=Astrephomene gubernaculifera TaxID=47775 RepID=A0AAD3HKT0_9CHLO|nr:hypothetical protein Agub_g6314 [Astrephomene gubernaculifera]
MFGHAAKLSALINKDPPQLPNEDALVAELRAKLGPGADPEKLLFQVRSSRGKTHWAVNSYLRDVMTSSTPGQEDFRPRRPAAAGPAATPAAAASSSSSPRNREAAAASSPPAEATVALPGGCGCGCSSGGQHPASPAAGAASDLSDLNHDTPDPTTTTTSIPSRTTASCSPAPSLDGLPVSLLEAVCRRLEDHRDVCAAAMTCRALAAAASSDALWRRLFRSRWGDTVFPTEPHRAAAAGAAGGGQLGLGQQQPQQQPLLQAAPRSAMPPPPAAAGEQQAGGSLPSGSGLVSGAEGAEEGEALVAAGREQQQPLPLQHPAAAAAAAAAAAGGVTAAEATPGSPQAALRFEQLGASSGLPTAPVTREGGAAAAAAGKDTTTDAGGGHASNSNTTTNNNNGFGSNTGAASNAAGTTPSTSSYRQRYRQQLSYLTHLRCPRCGAADIVPIVYGFPSPALLEGMRRRRLILGGDHLIEDCHVWGCTACTASFRHFPYDGCERWLADLARSSSRQAAAAAAAGGHPHLPHYTYEL